MIFWFEIQQLNTCGICWSHRSRSLH